MGEVIRLNQLPEGSGNLTNDDILVFMDDPSGNKITKKLSLSALKNFIGATGGGNVDSVNGQTGVVVLDKNDIGLNNVDNTSDLNKPLSTAIQNALNNKENNIPSGTSNQYLRGDKSWHTPDKNTVGLGNVDNTSDSDKPISTTTQNALNSKAPINNPSFTGTVSGITKGMVGLGDVDNTSDFNKPISNATQNALNNKTDHDHTHHVEDVNNLQNLLDSKQPIGSYAHLVNGMVPSSELPSYVDEILEFVDFASFPNPGLSNKIYVDLSNNNIYRWGGTVYVNLNSSIGTTDGLLEGSTNLYFTEERARLAAPVQSVAGKIGSIVLDKSDVGLGDVNNTSDANKPVSNATQTALNTKAPINNPSFTGTVSGITKGMIGLGNVDNTSDTNKPVSNAQASAISNTQAYSIQRSNHTGTQLANTISDFNSAVNAAAPVQSVSGKTGSVTLNKNDIGLSNVDNTSDINKPISTATQTALNLKANASDVAINSIMNGRLCLVSGDPIPSNSDSVTGNTLYYTPYNGNKISLYDSVNNIWNLYTLTELSLNISGLTANTNYDIFVYNNAGTLTLESVAWSNNTTRSVSFIKQDSIYVKNGSINKRYIGSIRTTPTIGQCRDDKYRRFVWNYYNRISRRIAVSDSTLHTYNSATWRAWNNDTTVGTTRAELIIGIDDQVDVFVGKFSMTNGSAGIALDSTAPGYGLQVTSPDAIQTATSTLAIIPIGYHYFQMVESTASGIGTYNSGVINILNNG